jgi:site-specific recombinase XerD
MISLHKRGRTWYAEGQVKGRRVHKSLHTADRIVAEALKGDYEIHVLSGGRLHRVLWLNFNQEFIGWIESQIKPSTFYKYHFVLKRFTRFLAEERIQELRDITPATLAAYHAARQKDVHPNRGNTVGPEGMKSDMRILHRVFSYAVECEYIASNPVRYRRLNTVGGKTMPFTEDEISRVLADDHVKRWPQLRAILLTFLFTGLRISDVVRLPTKALDLQAGKLIIKTQKRGKIVSLAIHPELKLAIEKYLPTRNEAQCGAPYLFSTYNGKPALSLDAYLRRIFKRCGIANGHAHRFRDTFAVRLLAQGASLYDISKMMGINMTTAERHYAPYVSELQERAARLIGMLGLK